MAGEGLKQSLNAYLLLLIAVSTLGSLQFGYHLVSACSLSLKLNLANCLRVGAQRAPGCHHLQQEIHHRLVPPPHPRMARLLPADR